MQSAMNILPACLTRRLCVFFSFAVALLCLSSPGRAWAQEGLRDYHRNLQMPPDEQMIQAVQYSDLSTIRELLKQGVSPNIHNYGNHPLLMMALNSVYGRKAAFLLLASRADPNTKSDYGAPVLMYALREDDMELVNRLLDLGADVRLTDTAGDTPLHTVAWERKYGSKKAFHSELAYRLLRMGADINARNNEGDTPLVWAVEGSSLRAARFLLDHGADVRLTNKRGKNALDAAVGARRPDLLRLLLDRGAWPAALPLNALDENGYTRLMIAVFQSDPAEVRDLLKQGADPNVRGFYKATALCFAVETGDVEIPRLLLDAGADINMEAEYGQTPLIFATQNRKREPLELVRLLLDRGASVTPPVQQNITPIISTPIINAVRLGHLRVAALLVEHGADTQTRDKNGRTLLQIAIAHRQPDMTRNLLRRGLDVNAPAADGDSPLLESVYEGGEATDVVRALLDGGAIIEAANKEGKTALRVAAGLAQPRVFELLLAAGANPASAAHNGTTVVMAAARSGSVPILRHLLTREVDVNAQDQQGYTALMHAAHEGMAQTVALLLAHGANPDLRAADGSTALDVSRLYGYPGHAASGFLIRRAMDARKTR